MDQRFHADGWAAADDLRARYWISSGSIPPVGFDHCRDCDGCLGFRAGLRVLLASAFLVSVADDGHCANSRRLVVVGFASLDSGANGAPVPRTIALDVSFAQAG